MILVHNQANNKQKSYKITTVKMFATSNKAKPNTQNKRGLKFGGNEEYDHSISKLPLQGVADKSLA